jgi:hypothetical protein
MIQAFEQARAFHALDRAATVIGRYSDRLRKEFGGNTPGIF